MRAFNVCLTLSLGRQNEVKTYHCFALNENEALGWGMREARAANPGLPVTAHLVTDLTAWVRQFAAEFPAA